MVEGKEEEGNHHQKNMFRNLQYLKQVEGPAYVEKVEGLE